ncbi:MAG TPA: transposase [Acidimicrobiales bacterium]|nr:transposase [Acidimicrobiales bacterium]
MSTWLGLLALARSVFGVPSFAIFSDLLTGWVLTLGRHTITGVLTLGDPEARRAHDAYHRFVGAGRWATAKLWPVLVVHAVSLCCPEGVVEVLVDDTVAHKSGRKVVGAGVFRDAVRSTKNKVVYAWGLNVVVVCLRVSPPGVGRRSRCRSTYASIPRGPRPPWS